MIISGLEIKREFFFKKYGLVTRQKTNILENGIIISLSLLVSISYQFNNLRFFRFSDPTVAAFKSLYYR